MDDDSFMLQVEFLSVTDSPSAASLECKHLRSEGTGLGDHMIVGIGASAGGIAVLEGFFRQVPADSGMAFVIVTHLSPDRKSLLADVVSRQSSLLVRIAEDGAVVLPNTIFIMPETQIITISQGALRLTAIDPLNREWKPVDVSVSSLADDQD